jgi:hypothetical protein
MPHSSAKPLVPVSIRAADRGTEIFLVDGRLNVVASGVSELTAPVPPGVYKVRFRSGSTVRDQLVEVPLVLPRGQHSVSIYGSYVKFTSPAPLHETETTHEYQEEAWQRVGQAAAARVGSGAELLVLVRDPRKERGKPSRHQPWNGVTLTDAAGRELPGFSQHGICDREKGYGVLHLEVNPGVYLVRVETELYGTQAMAISACQGWQTCVWLASRSYQRISGGRLRTARRADLTDAAVFMFRPGHPPLWDPAGPAQTRLTELARQALAQGRQGVQLEDLNAMLEGKFENPMLGIYGAHLLARQGRVQESLFAEVLRNLGRLVPDHPDVRALQLLSEERGPIPALFGGAFDLPPMLMASWLLVIEESLRDPLVVPPGSLSDRIGPRLLGGGPWVVWREAKRQPAARPHGGRSPFSGAGGPLDAPAVRVLILDDMMPAGAAGSAEAPLSGSRDLPSLLSAVAEAYPRSRLSETGKRSDLAVLQRALVSAVAAQPAPLDQESADAVVRSLGVPAATVARTAASLL